MLLRVFGVLLAWCALAAWADEKPDPVPPPTACHRFLAQHLLILRAFR
jgi:hypothetical protein